MIQVPEDLVDVIWTDPSRPPIPNNPLIVHPIEFTGRSVRWRSSAVVDPDGTKMRRTFLSKVFDGLYVKM